MKLFRVLYRMNGRIDHCFCVGEDEMAARMELLRRFPKASFVKASLAKEEEYENNVIVVDFKNKRKAS